MSREFTILAWPYHNPSDTHADFEIEVLGVIRKDYIPIKDGYGNPGFFFPLATEEERCNVTIRRIT